jgi:hypothetical protein
MHNDLIQIKNEIYDTINLDMSDFKIEQESIEYYACRFKLNEKIIVSRNAKITKKKRDSSLHYGNEIKTDRLSLLMKLTELIFMLLMFGIKMNLGSLYFQNLY